MIIQTHALKTNWQRIGRHQEKTIKKNLAKMHSKDILSPRKTNPRKTVSDLRWFGSLSRSWSSREIRRIIHLGSIFVIKRIRWYLHINKKKMLLMLLHVEYIHGYLWNRHFWIGNQLVMAPVKWTISTLPLGTLVFIASL